jgi:hypothetical protein
MSSKSSRQSIFGAGYFIVGLMMPVSELFGGYVGCLVLECHRWNVLKFHGSTQNDFYRTRREFVRCCMRENISIQLTRLVSIAVATPFLFSPRSPG